MNEDDEAASAEVVETDKEEEPLAGVDGTKAMAL